MAGKSSATNMFAILLVSLCIFSALNQFGAARMTQEVIGNSPSVPGPGRIFCPACVCCSPAPPGRCCPCCTTPPIEEQTTSP